MGEDKIIYKKESYKIVGLCFEVYNQIGPGHREKTYQRALEELLKYNRNDFPVGLPRGSSKESLKTIGFLVIL